MEGQRLGIDKKKPVSRVKGSPEDEGNREDEGSTEEDIWKLRRRGKSRTTYLAVDSSSIRRGLVENFAVDSRDPADGSCACR